MKYIFRYPVILSIENHCGIQQQSRMASIMKTVFGGRLEVNHINGDHLPSPEDLKYKILIKVYTEERLELFVTYKYRNVKYRKILTIGCTLAASLSITLTL